MRKALFQSFPKAMFGLGFMLLGLAAAGIHGGHWSLVPLACCCVGAAAIWASVTFIRTSLRAYKAHSALRELEQARRQLSDLAVDLLDELSDYSKSEGYKLASDLSARLQRELPDVERELAALEQCGLSGHLGVLLDEQLAPLYFQWNPAAKWWLKEERARRDFLLEQPGPAPGPRSRPSALAG